MPRALAILLALVAALVAAAPAVAAAPYVPGEVIVSTGGEERVVPVKAGETVKEAAADLTRKHGVRYAVPNYIARASAFVPNDPGRGGARNWQRLQWNFLPTAGVGAPDAWQNVIAAGAPGGKGTVVAVLDTGVAYATRGRYVRSPDFAADQFVRGYDFVGRDSYPLDENGHGTFIAGLIAERTDNGRSLTGLAYGTKIMPVRVLDSQGLGDAAAIADGIRFAARRGADVINLSLEFDASVRAAQIPGILSAIRFAHSRGAIVVGASGNEAARAVAYPARAAFVISVGATTEHLCQADYSNEGQGLDLVAPGGGADAPVEGDPNCQPTARAGRDIFQVTFTNEGGTRRFGIHTEQGTSMAAPHVSAAAALVIASGVIGRSPTPIAVANRLKQTARDLGAPGPDSRYGAGLLNAAAATSSTAPPPTTPVAAPPQTARRRN